MYDMASFASAIVNTLSIYYAASADDGAVDQHRQPVRKENTKLFPGLQVRNKNITVMEEVSYIASAINGCIANVY